METNASVLGPVTCQHLSIKDPKTSREITTRVLKWFHPCLAPGSAVSVFEKKKKNIFRSRR